MSEGELPGPLTHYEPTQPYQLRVIANGIVKEFGHATGWTGTDEQHEVINAAYKHLLRAANQLERIEQQAKGERP